MPYWRFFCGDVSWHRYQSQSQPQAEAERTEGTEAGQGGTLKLLWESTMRTNGEKWKKRPSRTNSKSRLKEDFKWPWIVEQRSREAHDRRGLKDFSGSFSLSL